MNDGSGPGARACETAHLLALGAWAGAVFASGVVAAVVFPLARELDPTVPAYAAFSGSHADLLAGRIAARVFLIADVVQFGAALVVLATTIALAGFLGWRGARVSPVIRLVCVGGALLTLSYQLMVLRPRMDDHLHRYWASAEAGRTDEALAHREAFIADHPKASRSLSATGALVVGAFGAGAWGAQGRRARGTPA